MKNRAKCKLCKSIIESFHRYDYVSCSCGEISVDGGTDHQRCLAKNWDNFLRVDDEGNEIVVKIKEKEEIDPIIQEQPPHKPTRDELLQLLKDMIDTIEKLPPQAMNTPVTHYDLVSALLVISSIFRST